MKNVYLIILLLTVNTLVSANDTWIYNAYSGSPIKINEDHNKIELINETITVKLEKDYYYIDVLFNFYNHGNDVNTVIGFPKFYWTGFPYEKADTEFIDFETFVNGKKVDSKIQKILKYDKLSEFLTKEVYIPSKSKTTTEIRYKSKYATYGGMGHKSVPYLYGTGKTWAKESWDIDVKIINNSNKWIKRFQCDQKIYKFSNKNNVIDLIFKDVNPNEFTEYFEIVLKNNFDEMFDFYWDIYGEKNIKQDELTYLNDNQLRLYRNAFFAKDGYIFKSKDLQNYFKKFDWYKENNDFNPDVFSNIEKNNIKLISIEEKKRK